jgi:hypothetical protein
LHGRERAAEGVAGGVVGFGGEQVHEAGAQGGLGVWGAGHKGVEGLLLACSLDENGEAFEQAAAACVAEVEDLIADAYAEASRAEVW